MPVYITKDNHFYTGPHMERDRAGYSNMDACLREAQRVLLSSQRGPKGWGWCFVTYEAVLGVNLVGSFDVAAGGPRHQCGGRLFGDGVPLEMLGGATMPPATSPTCRR